MSETGAAPAGAPSADGLHARIKDAVDLCNAGSVLASLELLKKLRRDEWTSASSHNRCRLLTAIGFAHFVLCDETDAANEFRAAYAEDPDRPGARAVLALAHQLSGDHEAAFATAKQALSDDPTCAQAAAILAISASSDRPLPELKALIPDALLGRSDVLLGLATAARTRQDHDAALGFAEAAHARAPTDWRTRATLAEELLGPVFEDETIALTKAVPGEFAERFGRGLELLRNAWGQVKVRDHARSAIHVAANLAAALAVSGDEDGAELVIDEGLRVHPDDRTLLRRRAIIFAIRNDWSGACRVLSRIPIPEREPSDRLLHGKAALMCGDVEGARSAVAEMLDDLPVGDRARQSAEALALEAALAAGEGASAITAAWDANPDSIILRSAALDTAQADSALRDRLLADVLRIASTVTDNRDLAMAADALQVIGEHSRAADLFAALEVPLDRDTPVLSGRLRALILADRRREARELFEAIAAPVRELRPYCNLGIALYDRVGMLPRAIGLAEQHLKRKPDDLRIRLMWIDLCERGGRTGDVQTWISGVPATVAGSARELMALAQLLDRYQADIKCLQIGYRALRRGYSDPAIHVAYAFGLFVMGRAVQAGRPSPGQVGPDTAVTLEQIDHGTEFVRVIETEPDPRLERDEVPPNDAFALRLVGLRVGEEFETPSPHGEPRRFRVKLIEDKFLYAQRRCLTEFHLRFPESQAFSSFTVDVNRGEEGVAPVLRMVRRRAEHVADVIDRYKAGELPLPFAATIAGSSVYDTWDGFRTAPDVSLFCSLGTQEETDLAAAHLQAAELCILDPLVPYSAVRLGVAEPLRASLPRVGVTQSTLDMLRDLVEERRREHSGRQGSLLWAGDRYVMHEMSNCEIETRIDVAERALAFAARCELVPAEAPNPIASEAARIYSLLPPAFLDATLSAQGAGRMLLCDDLVLRSFAQTEGVCGTWTQAALQHGVSRGRIAPDIYGGAVAQLAAAGYSYVRVGAPDILHELRRAEWRESDLARELLRRLALPGNDPSSVERVAQDLVLLAYGETQGDHRFDHLAAALARQFEEAQPAKVFEYLDAILSGVATVLRARAWRLNSSAWLQTTSLVPPSIAERIVIGPVSRITRRIGASLTNGLAGAVGMPEIQTRGPRPMSGLDAQRA